MNSILCGGKSGIVVDFKVCLEGMYLHNTYLIAWGKIVESLSQSCLVTS